MQAPEPALIVHNAPNSVKEFRDKRGDGVPRKGWRPCDTIQTGNLVSR